MNLKKKLLLIKTEIAEKGIAKNAVNTHLKYKYAELSDILNIVNKVTEKHGVLLMIQIRLDPQMTTITSKLIYEGIINLYDIDSEETIQYTYSFPSDTAQKINDIQAYGSTMTYAQRYMLGALFGIAYDNENPDRSPKSYYDTLTNSDTKKDVTDLITEAQNKLLYAKMQQNKMSKENATEIINRFGYSNSKEIKKKDFNKILQEFNNE